MTKTTNSHSLTITVMMDGGGNYAVGKDEDEAQEKWDDQSEGNPSGGLRIIHLTLEVPSPRPTILKATLPEDAQDGDIKIGQVE